MKKMIPQIHHFEKVFWGRLSLIRKLQAYSSPSRSQYWERLTCQSIFKGKMILPSDGRKTRNENIRLTFYIVRNNSIHKNNIAGFYTTILLTNRVTVFLKTLKELRMIFKKIQAFHLALEKTIKAAVYTN